MDYLLTHRYSWMKDGDPCLDNVDQCLYHNKMLVCKEEPHCDYLENVKKESNTPTERFVHNNHRMLDCEATCSFTENTSRLQFYNLSQNSTLTNI